MSFFLKFLFTFVNTIYFLLKKKILIILFILPQLLIAQINFVHFSPADGLVQSNITSLFQDSKGYIWIGTHGGLSRFDGFEFTNYTIFDGLGDNYIVKVIEDMDGYIWVLNQKHINKLDGNNFISYSLDSASKFQDIEIDTENRLWILDVNTKKQSFYYFENNSFFYSSINKNYYCNDLFYSKNLNSLLAITNKGIYSITNKENTKLVNDNSFEYGFNSKKGNTYFVSETRTCKYSDDNLSLSFDKNKNIFVHTRLKNDEFICINKNQKHIYSYKSEKDIRTIAKNTNIEAILVDNQENIWLGSDKGLYKITAFHNFSDFNGNYTEVKSIVEDMAKNIIFITNEEEHIKEFGIYSIDKKQNLIHKPDIKITNNKSDKKVNFQFGAVKLSNNVVILPTDQNFFYVYKEQRLSKIEFTHLKKQQCVFEDTSNNKIIFGTTNGLFITNNSFYISKYIDEIFVDNQKNITGIEKGKDGNIYLCTSGGLGVYNYKSVRFFNKDSIPIVSPKSIHKDYKGNLWVAALNGLFLYDYKNFYKIKHQELTTNITAVNSTNNNTLIVGTVKGIGFLNLNKMYKNNDTTVRFYDKSSGFLGVEVVLNGIYNDSDGNVWVATKTNVVKFNPKKLTENTTPPITLITCKSYLDKELNPIPINDSIKVLLYNQNNINISYTGISHRAPNQVMYKYQLQGYDESISPSTKKRTVTYTNLPPGKYTFNVWACNESGIWNSKPTTWHFQIGEAIWQKRWFKYAYISAIIIITFLLTLAGVRFFYKRREHKLKIIDLQFHSFSNQLYPHFLFNAIANISGAIYTQDQDTAYDYTTKLTALIRQVQEDQKSIQRTLKDELLFVEKYIKIQKFRFENRFDYKFKIDPKIDLNIKVPQMILQTFTENAIKHGLEHLEQGGKLLVEGRILNKNIIFVVQDNGIGFDASKNIKKISSGQGLKIIDEILKLYNSRYKTSISYKISDLKKYKLQGTRIEIVIPIKFLKNHGR